MAKIRTILNGFVDLNLDTDENFATRIGYKEEAQRQAQQEPNSQENSNSLSSIGAVELTLPIPLEQLVNKVGVEISEVKMVHIQGSRLYGVDSPVSDWDLAVIASGINGYQFKEATINNEEYDIHLYSQSRFQTFLDHHNMKELESVYHPVGVRLIDNIPLIVNINPDQLVDKAREESDSLWERARADLNEGKDAYTAHKKIWHSFRFLNFAEQILETGEIYDFSAANGFYDLIVKSGRNDFLYFEENFGNSRDQIKADLERFKSEPIDYEDSQI